MITIEVKHRTVYGVDLIDVCDPDVSCTISQLTGKKTVSKRDLANLEKLGCKVIDLDEVMRVMFN